MLHQRQRTQCVPAVRFVDYMTDEILMVIVMDEIQLLLRALLRVVFLQCPISGPPFLPILLNDLFIE